jgi:uncharacterized protein YifE (UPF0438 family)
MSTPPPPDHAALLARRDFVFPPGEYTAAEREVLTRFGRWLEALATGSILPTSPGQAQFVQCARGQREPETEFEHAWRTVLRNRGIGFDVAAALRTLTQARAEKAALEAEYSAARTAVLALVREQLDAVDVEFAMRLAEAADAAATAEAAFRDIVLRTGKNVNAAGVRAIYNAPRISWDTEKLEVYAEAHPEVLAFRKLGKPFVTVRFSDGQPSAKSDAKPATAPESDQPE